MAMTTDISLDFREHFENKTFDSWDEFIHQMDSFQEATNSVFKPKNSTSVAYGNRARKEPIPERFKFSTAKFICIHFGQPVKEGTGQKKVLRYLGLGCPAFLTVSYAKGALRVTKSHMCHENHLLDPEANKHYARNRQLTEDEKEEVREIIQMGAGNQELKSFIRRNFGKAVLVQDVKNLKRRFKAKNNIQSPSFSEMVSQTETNNNERVDGLDDSQSFSATSKTRKSDQKKKTVHQGTRKNAKERKAATKTQSHLGKRSRASLQRQQDAEEDEPFVDSNKCEPTFRVDPEDVEETDSDDDAYKETAICATPTTSINTAVPVNIVASNSASLQSGGPQTELTYKRKRLSEEDPQLEATMKIYKSTVSRAPNQQDYCDVYGQHVANKLKSYNQRTRAIVQHHINNTLFSADMGDFDRITKHFTPSTNMNSTNASPSSYQPTVFPGGNELASSYYSSPSQPKNESLFSF